MKKNKTSILKAIGLLAFCIPLLGACIPQNARPQPTLDPIYLTADAQTVKTRVKYLNDISAEDPERDKEIINDETNPHWIKIESEWINFYRERDYETKERVYITVTENNTGKERRYTLKLIGYVFDGTLTVIQETKISDR